MSLVFHVKNPRFKSWRDPARSSRSSVFRSGRKWRMLLEHLAHDHNRPITAYARGKVYQLLTECGWFPTGNLVSFNGKTDRHDVTSDLECGVKIPIRFYVETVYKF